MTASKILCLSPHPDDIEFSMGGTILKYNAVAWTSVVFSTGSVYDPVSNETRWQECRNYWKDVPQVEQHFLAPLLKMYSEEEWLNLLEKRFPLKDYDALYLPPLLDTHYEHRLVHHIGMAMTRVTPAAVFEYRSASCTDSWIPNMFLDINNTAQEKVERLARFESQNKVYFKPEYMKAIHSHTTAMKKGLTTTEQFRMVSLYI